MKITFCFSVVFVCFLLCHLSGKLSAQENQYPNAALPSASSAALISSVNHSTGRVDVSVPLFTFESSGIRVPVGISYNTSGIRVEDRPTEVGYGWRLTAGGKITRVVRQRPDDLQNTSQVWGSSALSVAQAFFSPIDRSKYVSYNEIDSEPDLFYYEIPGKSGMFVLDGAGKPHTIPYQPDLTISVVDGTYFTIRDNAGTVYTFGSSDPSRENTTVLFKNENLQISHQTEMRVYVSTWHLENITDYSGNRVFFSYLSGSHETTASTTHIAAYQNTRPYAPTSGSWEMISEQTHRVSTSTIPLLLLDITSGQTSIRFNWGTGSDGKFVSDVIYYVNDSQINRAFFSYETFANNRVFLTQIQTTGGGTAVSDRKNLCSFTYNKSRLLPPHDSYDYDSWGYYNGKNNNTHLPVVLPGDVSGFYGTIPGADKSPVLEYAQACMLTTIVHNTGGKVEYAYGLNKDYNTDIGGLRVERVVHRDETNQEVSSTRYEYNNPVVGGLGSLPRHVYLTNNTSHPVLTISSRPFYDLFFTSGAHIMYGEITEIAPDGSKTAYVFSTPGTSPTETYANAACTFWDYSNYQWLEDVSYFQPAMVTKPKTSRFWRHGLLLKRTKYDSSGATVEETSYTYKHDHPKLTIIKGFAPCVLKDPIGNDAPHLFEYSWESQPVLLASKTVISSVAPTMITHYTYDTEWVAPTRTVQSAPDKTIETTYRYAHDLTRTPIGANFPTKILAEAGILAPVETVTQVNGLVTAAELTEYEAVSLVDNRQAVLPYRKYHLLLQSPVTSITPADYPESYPLAYDSRYRSFQAFEYDRYGRPQNFHATEGRVSSVLYAKDPNGKRIDEQIAEVSHATANQVVHESFEYMTGAGIVTTPKAKTGQKVYSGGSFEVDLRTLLTGVYVLSYWKSNDSGQTWEKVTETGPMGGSVKTISNTGWIDEVRVHPADARMKTRTYLSGVGVSSETDHNGRTVYREYDPFGRPSRVLDNERRVLEMYEYYLKNE